LALERLVAQETAPLKLHAEESQLYAGGPRSVWEEATALLSSGAVARSQVHSEVDSVWTALRERGAEGTSREGAAAAVAVMISAGLLSPTAVPDEVRQIRMAALQRRGMDREFQRDVSAACTLARAGVLPRESLHAALPTVLEAFAPAAEQGSGRLRALVELLATLPPLAVPPSRAAQAKALRWSQLASDDQRAEAESYLRETCLDKLPGSWSEIIDRFCDALQHDGPISRRRVREAAARVATEQGRGSYSARLLRRAARAFPFSRLQLQSMSLRPGGRAESNYHQFAVQHLGGLAELPSWVPDPRAWPDQETAARQAPRTALIQRGRLAIDDGTPRGDVLRLDQAPITQYGRTAVYRGGSGKIYHVKYRKHGESPESLRAEFTRMNDFAANREVFGLLGHYPPARALVSVTRDQAVGLDLRPRSHDGTMSLMVSRGRLEALVYEVGSEADSRAFRRYLTDPSLSPDDFRRALRVSLHDRMQLARRGLFDLEMTQLFHNRADGARRYDWMIDLPNWRSAWPSYGGAGRIHDIVGSALFPNDRLSGVADVAGFAHVDHLNRQREIADGRLSRLSARFRDDGEQALRTLKIVAHLGDTILSSVLEAVVYHLRRGELSYRRETRRRGTPLQQSLAAIFHDAYRFFSGSSAPLPFELDTQRMARQIAYGATGQHQRDHDAGKRPPSGLYRGLDGVEIRPNGEAARGRFWDVAGRSYDSPAKGRGRARPRVASFDAGPFNGPTDWQEVIRALYMVAPMAAIERATAATAAVAEAP
jgi:hypothetical protein